MHVSYRTHVAHITEVVIVYGTKKKALTAQNEEALILQRLISSKIRSGGPQTVQYKEVLIIGRCSHIEVLLYCDFIDNTIWVYCFFAFLNYSITCFCDLLLDYFAVNLSSWDIIRKSKLYSTWWRLFIKASFKCGF